MTTQASPSVLLVPGSWHGAWAYDDVRAGLAERGLAARAIDLPSNDGGGLADDAAAVRGALDEIGPAVVVGHSYGGIAVSEGAAEAPQAIALVYLCAFMLDVGESLLDAMRHELPPWLAVDPEAGTCRPERAEEVLFGDCSGEQARDAAARLVPQSLTALATPQTAAAWRALPSSYLICDLDRAVPPAAQEAMSARAGTVEHVHSSHSPFLSHPDVVVDLIARAAQP